MSTKITKNGFRFSKRNYHRRGAHGLQIGSYGIKNLIRGMSHYSYVKGVEELELESMEAIRLSQFSNSQINLILEAKPSYLPFGADGVAGLNRERIREHELELKRFSLKDVHSLRDAINTDKDCLGYMRRRLSRIVDTVWVIIDARIQTSTSLSGELKMHMEPAKGILKLSGQTGGQHSRSIDLQIGADTVFAYRLLRPRFQGRRREGTVQFLNPDYRGVF